MSDEIQVTYESYTDALFGDMVFPCNKRWEPNYGKELFVSYHLDLSEDQLREDIRAFLKELKKKK